MIFYSDTLFYGQAMAAILKNGRRLELINWPTVFFNKYCYMLSNEHSCQCWNLYPKVNDSAKICTINV